MISYRSMAKQLEAEKLENYPVQLFRDTIYS